MAQQTAVEWLIEQLPIRTINSFSKEIEQAKTKEKMQIKMAYNDGADHMVESKYEGMDNYYKLRYGSNNQI